MTLWIRVLLLPHVARFLSAFAGRPVAPSRDFWQRVRDVIFMAVPKEVY